jgi:TRAP transporter TAXI family solute receptor
VASIRDLATSIPITMVAVPADVATKLGPPFVATTIPANTYNGQTADVPTLAVVNFLVTHAGVPDDVVYQMTKQLFENLDQMVAAHKAASAIKLETATNGMPLPLHPGAERFYREKGLIK